MLDAHFPTHGNWQGLACGRMATIWLRSILSRGDHRLVHVEPWVAQRQIMLRQVTGEVRRAHECSDDRLAMVLRLLRDDSRWTACASALNQHLVRVYDLRTARVPVESTSASAHAGVSAEGLLQCGHSKEHRPDVPQVKVLQAVLDPVGMPLATDVVAGNRADAPLSVPCLERVPASVGRRGLVYVGDCQMAARETRAWRAHQGAYSLCPRPHGQLAEGEWAAAGEALDRGEVALRPVCREPQDGEAERIAEGYARQAVRTCEAHGASQTWMERRFVVRSLRHAKAAAVSLRARGGQAQAQVEALNQRGRGRQRCAEGAA